MTVYETYSNSYRLLSAAGQNRIVRFHIFPCRQRMVTALCVGSPIRNSVTVYKKVPPEVVVLKSPIHNPATKSRS